MKCPVCNASTEVLATRDRVKRHRQCSEGHRFWTEETVIVIGPRRQQSSPVQSRSRQDMLTQLWHAPQLHD